MRSNLKISGCKNEKPGFQDTPIGSKQLLASLETKAGISRANDCITKWDFVLASDVAHNRFKIVVLHLLGTLPRCEVSVFSVIAV